MINRREFIKLLSTTGTILLAPLRGPGQLAGAASLQGETPGGELYSGFLLLEEEAPVPEFIQFPTIPMPNGCGIGIDRKNAKPSAISRFFETPRELANGMPFRVYLPERMPEGLRDGKAYTFSNANGSLYEASLAYESYNSELQLWETTVSFWIQLHYPKPLPLWSASPVEAGVPGISYDKVDFLPSSGLRLATQRGFVYYWIENDLFYTLSFEPLSDETAAIDFISRLVPSR